jgi:dihydroorotate dehydrogenase
VITSYRLLRPLLHLLEAENAHHLAIRALQLGLGPHQSGGDDPILATKVWGIEFPNPIGLAAGFDKHAEVFDAALGIGFGFVEAGTVTPRPQPGRDKPRLFRLDEDEAVINRFGFNSEGLAVFAARLAARRGSGAPRGVVGANIGKNKDSADAAADYVACIDALCGVADYIVVNVSSPNTPGLRNLQARAEIEALLQAVVDARRKAARQAGRTPPLVVKVAPDLAAHEIEDVAQVCSSVGIDGLIVANTTIARPDTLRSKHKAEEGGLSGKPLFAPSTERLRQFYRATEGKLPIIGCGGVASGDDAYAKVRAGASLVQLYSALVFQGPELVGRIKRELAARLRADGFKSVAEAVGTEHGRAKPKREAARRQA